MQTERLIFKFYEEKDRDDFIALFTDPAVMKYVGDGVLTNEQAEAFWRKLFEKLYPGKVNIWAVFAKDDSRYVGHAGIYPRPTKRKTGNSFIFSIKIVGAKVMRRRLRGV
jgi:RimJ/RimL family protein N-acetyltransferase